MNKIIKIKSVITLLVSIMFFSFTAQAVEDLDYENGNMTIPYYYEDGRSYQRHAEGYYHTPVILSGGARSGDKYVSFAAPANNNTSISKDRSELFLLPNVAQPPWGQLKKTEFSFRLANSFPMVNDWMVLFQWHQGQGESPPVAFEVTPGTSNRIRVVLRTGENKANHQVKFFDLGYLPKGQWQDIVAKVRFSTNPANGKIEIYLNGQLKVNYVGSVGYSNVTPGFYDIKYGVYSARQNAYRRIDYDNVYTN